MPGRQLKEPSRPRARIDRTLTRSLIIPFSFAILSACGGDSQRGQADSTNSGIDMPMAYAPAAAPVPSGEKAASDPPEIGSLRLCLSHEEVLIDSIAWDEIAAMSSGVFRSKANDRINKSRADSVDAGLAPALAQPFAAAAIARMRWPIGMTLRVRFLGGDPALQQRVVAIANEWSRYGRFQFVQSNDLNAEIRVRFSATENTSWSRVGRARPDVFRSPNTATMLLGRINLQTDVDTLRALVLHEFGHALGLVHEHQHPNSTIRWNERATIDYYWRTFQWREEDVRRSVFGRLSRDSVVAGTYDEKSVMHYSVPASLTMDGRGVPFNAELSPLDRQFIGLIY